MRIKKILIACRGEIALRILRTCRSMKIATVAIYTQTDNKQKHLHLADETICIGETHDYSKIDRVISAAHISQADAIHPGYGFLSENAEFAKKASESGIQLIGPSSDIIALMGNKLEAKTALAKLNIPGVPGSKTIRSIKQAKQYAKNLGYPIIIKAASGGGGRGMQVITAESELEDALIEAKKTAQAYFGSDQVYLEKYLQAPRHIEVQIVGDQFNHIRCLGSRDCSTQRKHQKIIEESPVQGIEPDLLKKIHLQCIFAAEKLGYSSAGTFEFLYHEGRFYFIEMNTRIQVEHPVTEMVTGIDIIQEQIEISQGKNYQESSIVATNGHAIECRICSEDPVTFMPCAGTVTDYHPPSGPGVRFDDYIYQGYQIPHHFDSLIAKLIVHSSDRKNCLNKATASLDECIIGGITTNIPLLEKILHHQEFHQQKPITFLQKSITGENYANKTTQTSQEQP